MSSGNIGVWGSWFGVGVGTIYASLELKAGSVDHCVLAINSGANWGGLAETRIADLSSTEWRTVSWQFEAPSTANFNFHIGIIPPDSSFTQGAGTILLKNLRFHKVTDTATISAVLSCVEDVTCARGISATSFLSTSDLSVKTNITDASLDDCWELFQAVNPRTYTRTDLPDQATRIGFIAQEVDDATPTEFLNLLGRSYQGPAPLLQLDYSRLVCVLWGALKKLEQRVIELET
jgi:hypothetical protein